MDIHQLLKEYFGFKKFKEGQELVVRDVIARKDTIAILPTGSGKSLCYQLPGYALSGLVLIISPLVALMEDQVAIMKRNGEKRVVALNSFLPYVERNQIVNQLSTYKFVFISPEMLVQPSISSALQRTQLALIVVDEAHCISQWGFDFRPDYLRIGAFFDNVNRPNILALTATADEQVISEISHYLHLENPVIHRSALDRPNISYTIKELENKSAKTKWIVNRVKTTVGPGIIYVSSRKRADELKTTLLEQRIAAASYHAGMEQEDRAFIQEQFLAGEIHWICATNAFGMGIHKDNIRQIIHEQLPATIAGFTQEVGRAGRDGGLSAATLLFAPEDERKTRFILQDDIPLEEEIRYFSSLISDHKPIADAAKLAGLSETGVRVVQYYLERMSIDETVRRLEELKKEKEIQFQKMLKIIHSDKCIRAEVLAFFGDELKDVLDTCCSNCHSQEDAWLFEREKNNVVRDLVDWSKRLSQLLGS